MYTVWFDIFNPKGNLKLYKQFYLKICGNSINFAIKIPQCKFPEKLS